MSAEIALIVAVVVVALVFDYTNGFHDAANAIATSVSTGALTPRVALAMAAVMNFVGAFLGQKVATTRNTVIAWRARYDAAGTKTAGIIRAGRKKIPYAGAVHWGWPSRGIAAQPYMTEGAQRTESIWVPLYQQLMDDALKKVKGK